MLVYFVVKTLRKRISCCGKFYKPLKSMLFYDTWIRFIIESNLELCYESIFFLHTSASFDNELEKT